MKWVPEIQHFCPHVPIVLVGKQKNEVSDSLKYLPKIVLCSQLATKIDLRDDPSESCYSTSDGRRLKKKIKAQSYKECSAIRNEGLEQVIEEAVRVAQRHRTVKRNATCTIL